MALVWVASLVLLRRDLGKAKHKPRFRDLLSKSRAINILSAARMCLFGARDVWFVVALPVFLAQSLGWDFWRVGGFLAAWVIGYGVVQAVAPKFTGLRRGALPDGRAAFGWAAVLAGIPAVMLPFTVGGSERASAMIAVATAALCGVMPRSRMNERSTFSSLIGSVVR